MLKDLLELDQQLFLNLNHWSGPGLDPVMLFLSGTLPWLVFILLFLILIFRQSSWNFSEKRIWISIGILLLTYLLTEQISVHLFKNLFERLRPCQEPELLGKIRLVAKGCGGQYGFVSTHASNSFSLALVSALLIKQRWFTICVFLWAALISYSRIYLGVHYPGDVIGGAALGMMIGSATLMIYKWLPYTPTRTGERGSPLREKPTRNRKS